MINASRCRQLVLLFSCDCDGSARARIRITLTPDGCRQPFSARRWHEMANTILISRLASGRRTCGGFCIP